MQKKLLAVAVLGALSSAAFAQSANVTVYGRMKMNYEQLSVNGGSNNANAAGVAAPAAGLNLGDNSVKLGRMQQSSSLIGFRGTEDLGNGLSAIWQIETDVAGDEQGSGSGTFANRDTFVGVRSNTWGQFAFGHFDTYFTTTGRYLEAPSTYAWSLGHDAALNLMNTSRAGAQTSFHSGNTIQYISPNWNGFVWKQQFSPNAQATERKAAGNATATVAPAAAGVGTNGLANTRQWMTDVSYTNGPWVAGITYIKTINGLNSQAGNALINGSATVSATTSVAGATIVQPNQASYAELNGLRIGGSYTFGMGIRVGLIYDSLKTRVSAPTTAANALLGAANDTKRTAWALPISYKTGNHTIAGIYAKAGNTSGIATTAGSVAQGSTAATTFGDTTANSYSIAYDYAFSKRTSVGVQYSVINNGNNASYDFWSRGVGGTTTTGGLIVGQDPKMFSVGMRHIF